MDCSQGISPNPDLIGIGVRLSIYIQTVLPQLARLIVATLTDERVASTKVIKKGILSTFTLLLTGYALVFSAIIQARTMGLTVYHALLVLDLSWLIFLSSMALLYYVCNGTIPSKLKPKAWTAFIISFLHLTLTASFGIWLFFTLDTFDSTNPSCTGITILSIPGRNFLVLSKQVQIIWLVAYSIVAVPFANIVVVYFVVVVFWPWILYNAGLFARRAYPWFSRKASWCARKIQPWRTYPTAPAPPAPVPVGAVLDDDYSRATLLSCLVLESLVIASTELTIKHNRVQPGEQQWSFGQTLSLFLIIPAVIEAVLLILNK